MTDSTLADTKAVTSVQTAASPSSSAFASLPLRADAHIAQAAENELREIAQRYQLISELTSDFAYCFRVELDGSLVLEWMSDSVNRKMGYTVEEVNRRSWLSFLHPDDLPIVLQQWQQLLSGKTDVSEYRVQADSETVLWLRNHGQPVWDEAQQRVVRIFGAAQDITEKKLADQRMAEDQAQIALLNRRLQRAMRESFHRIKNNLQLVASLIEMQAMDNHGALPAQKVEQLSAHLRALAAVHNLLTQEVRDGETAPMVSARALLEKLCALMQQAAGGNHLHCCVEEARVPGRQATSLALIVNELVQNAFKHCREEVHVAFSIQSANQKNKHLEDQVEDQAQEVNAQNNTDQEDKDLETSGVLEIYDDGEGFPTNFDSTSTLTFGLPLVEDLAFSDLRGTVHYDNRLEGGARVRIIFPMILPTPTTNLTE